jgi:signal transduction histidine kinase/ActR/RegA family two-component response regulator
MATDTAIRAAIQKLLEGVQIIGYDWTYLYLNEAAERHARRQAHELIGRRMTDCYPGIHETPMFEALQRVMRARKPEQFLSEFVYPDGTQGWFELLIEPVPDGVCVLSLDISDKQHAQAQLRQAQKMEAVGRLAGGIAHDFNNVLTAMLGFCDLVLARSLHDSELTADLQEIRKAGERAERLTRQLLAFSRKQVLVPQVIDLNHVVLDVHAMLTRLIGENIRLVIDTARDVRHTKADPGQVEQILMNLVVNARDAMPHGGTLRVSTANVTLDRRFVLTHPGSIAGDYVALAVEDTGNGIPQEILAHVFEPFFTTKGPGKGTGLGLPTVYGIVKQSGGYVAIDTKPGVGTTITTYLPVVNEPLSEPVPRVELRTVNGNETVLLVEDDESARELMRKALSPHGYTVLEARDVWDALTLARSRPTRIDLLLTDIVMPDMNGPQLAQHIVTVHPKIRVLYVSGFPQAAILGSSTVSARVSFLPKPFGPGALLASVREALDRQETA